MTSACFHCEEPLPADIDIRATLSGRVNGREQAFCCHGCRAVAELIAGAGLDDYYRFRSTPAVSLLTTTSTPDEWRAFDRPELLAQLTTREPDGTRSATLALDSIGCAACGWLIDRMLKREPGVCAVNVNVATARLHIRWRDSLSFSALLNRIARLGYKPHPLNHNALNAATKNEKHTALKRLAVAGFGMMQVMMFAVAMYSSDLGATTDAMSPAIRDYLRGISLLCATPVMFYAGWPFFMNAWRAIRARAVVMDVPVSIALLLAYSASIWNTLTGHGEVYFDSVVMFVFFLSLGRFVEMLVRHRTGDVTDALARMMPLTAHRIRSNDIEEVGVSALSIDDEVWVRSGETVPADGVIIEGSSRIDEAMLTGESLPIARTVGSTVAAGTANMQSPLRVRVTAIGHATTLSSIVRLLHGAENAPLATAADRAASWFLGRILVGAGIVAAAWLAIDPSKAFEATLAVLVVTCPCALSLATPTALAAATATLARRGVLVTRSKGLETLAKITRVVFDKTGTLTHGQPSIYKCDVLADVSEADCYRIAAALEQNSEHPVARAFLARSHGSSSASHVLTFPGRGVEGIVDGCRYRIGRADFVAALRGSTADDALIHLGDAHSALAAFHVTDTLRNEASDVVTSLRARKLPSEILSGDAWSPVAHTAKECGIEIFNARQSPEDKLNYVRELSERGECIAMIGDGINDAPVLKGAAVSIAMGRASALAQVSADIVLVGDSLRALPDLIDVACKTQRVIKQNLTWAATYNLLALPLAAFGFVPPWLAAIGMSFSSIVVVLNAMRLAPARGTRDTRHERSRYTAPSSDLKPVASRQ